MGGGSTRGSGGGQRGARSGHDAPVAQACSTQLQDSSICKQQQQWEYAHLDVLECIHFTFKSGPWGMVHHSLPSLHHFALLRAVQIVRTLVTCALPAVVQCPDGLLCFGLQVEEVRVSLLCVQSVACNPAALLVFLGQGGLPLLLQAVRRPWAHCFPLQRAALAALEACCAAPHWAAGDSPHSAVQAARSHVQDGSEAVVARSDREQASLLACTSLLLGSDSALMEAAGLAGGEDAGAKGKEGPRERGTETEGGDEERGGARDGGGIAGVPGSGEDRGEGLQGGRAPMEEDEVPERQQSGRGIEEEQDEKEGRGRKRSLDSPRDGALVKGADSGLTGYAVLARILLRGGAQAGLSSSPAAHFSPLQPPAATGNASPSLLGLLLRLQAHEICLRLKVWWGLYFLPGEGSEWRQCFWAMPISFALGALPCFSRGESRGPGAV